jgi:hypothetical protein
MLRKISVVMLSTISLLLATAGLAAQSGANALFRFGYLCQHKTERAGEIVTGFRSSVTAGWYGGYAHFEYERWIPKTEQHWFREKDWWFLYCSRHEMFFPVREETRKGLGFRLKPETLLLSAVLLGAYPLLMTVRKAAIRRQRAKTGCCLRCGYDLTGNVSGACPECGLHRR